MFRIRRESHSFDQPYSIGRTVGTAEYDVGTAECAVGTAKLWDVLLGMNYGGLRWVLVVELQKRIMGSIGGVY